MGISNGLEKISDDSFASHNLSKPFIRTMDDDLKRIKKGSAGNGGADSSYSAPVPLSRASAPSYAPARSASRPLSAIPKNLPIDAPSVKRSDPKPKVKAEEIKPAEKPLEPKSAVNPPVSSVSPEAKPAVTEKFPPSGGATLKKAEEYFSKAAPASSPTFAAPVKKPQIAKKPWEENIENLSPEARLARQASMGDSDIGLESRENLIIPPSPKSSLAVSSRLNKPERSFNPIPPMPSSLEDRKKIADNSGAGSGSGSFLGKAIKFFLIILVVAGIGAGAYYYFFVMKRPAAVNPPVSSPLVSGVSQTGIKANLSADATADIKKYFSDSKSDGVYRVAVKDNEGRNNLEIGNFEKTLSVSLPDNIAGGLEKDYNLIVFSHPKENYLRLGLVFKVKNNFDISAAALSWEPNMQRNLNSLFLGSAGSYYENRQFKNNRYNNFNIRYLPLDNNNKALNYAVGNDKKLLLIASSKEDIFYLIDKAIKSN